MTNTPSHITREFDLTNELRWNACKQFVDLNWEAFKGGNNPLRVIVTTAEETRRAKQNRYYFGGVIKQIAGQALVRGRQFSQDGWHEHLADMFAPHYEMVTPGGSRSVRKSTSDMTVKEFSDYTEEVTAYAATELGVVFYLLDDGR